ncbi:MAG: CDP-alcohol phosphatidyltransferase family protein [Phycisphaerae bacterium]|nr:CDP-alcohol phosphatidyltransferase family protein [Phycisphaerae bacterium]
MIWPFALCLLYVIEPGYSWLRWLAIAIFAVMTASDALDGYLARRLRDESPLGKFLDPLADKVLITVAVLMLCVIGVRDISDPTGGTSFLLPRWVAVAAVGKDLVVSIGFAVVYLSTGRVFIRPRFLGKSCTVVQLLLVLSMLLWPDTPVWLSGLPKVLWYAATALAVAAVFDYVRLGSQYVATVAAHERQQGSGEDIDGQR